jgi:hypothetical protein
MVSAPVSMISTVEPPEKLPGMMDLILRGQDRLNDLMRSEAHLPALIRRLLVLSIAGLAVHGLVVGATIQLLGIDRTSELAFISAGHPAIWMPPVFVAAFLGALSICLPSFYFYTQLSGLDASFRLVTAQALRAQATTSVMLFGVLPMYVAIALAGVLHLFVDPDTVIAAGLAAPFFVGLVGIRAVYKGFSVLSVPLPLTHRRRGNFLGRLVLAWGAVYTAVAPVALLRLAEAASRLV